MKKLAVEKLDEIYIELSKTHRSSESPVEKMKNTIALIENYKQIFADDKEFFEKNKPLISRQFDRFFSEFIPDIDDVITIKSELGLSEESSDEDYSDDYASTDESIDSLSSSQETFTKTDAISEIKASTLTKVKRSQDERAESSEARSKIIIHSTDEKFKEVYLEHNLEKRYPEGGTGRVKKVFDSEGNLIGAVKIINSEILAKNEAKIAALIPDRTDKIFYGSLPDRGHGFKWYVFMPWMKGEKLLDHCTKIKKKRQTNPHVSDRLTMAKQAIEQVKFIHDKELIIGDIHNENFIINTEDHKLHLIDFACVHLKNETLSQEWVFNKSMLPLNLAILPEGEVFEKYSQKDDISNLAFTLLELFPEHCHIVYKQLLIIGQDIHTRFVEKTGNHSLIGTLVFNLMEKMTDPDDNSRPDIDQCLMQIEKIIEISKLIDLYTNKIDLIAQGEGDTTTKRKLIDKEIKPTLAKLKEKLLEISDPHSKQFHQLCHLAKKTILHEANSGKRKVDRLRVTPVEDLMAKNPARFSWNSTASSSKSIAVELTSSHSP